MNIPFSFQRKLQKFGVAAVYLFGSRAKGKTGPLSDYDFGVLMNEKVSEKTYFEKKLRLMAEFSSFLKHPSVEIVVLNEAPPLLAMNIIDGSLLLFDADSAFRTSYETRITMQYLDRLPYERRYLKTLLQSA